MSCAVKLAMVLLFALCIFVINISAVTQIESSLLPKFEEYSLITKKFDGIDQLIEHNFQVGVAGLLNLYENNSKCGEELQVMLNAISNKELWGIKVLDSFGSPPRTFSWGNYFWFGTPELCKDLNQPFEISLSHSQPPLFNATSPFPMQFVVIYFNFTSPYYIDLKLAFESLIHVGMCLPKSCSISDLRFYTNVYFQREYLQIQRNFKIHMKAIDGKILKFNWNYVTKIGSILLITILTMSVMLSIGAEIFYRNKNSTETKTHQNSPKHKTSTTTSQQVELQQSFLWEELLMCFRLSPNYQTVMSLENSNSNTNFVTAIAGLRSIVCIWITVFHVSYYGLFAISNRPLIFAKLEEFIRQPLLQACYYVDVFFTMSSFLLVYNFLSNINLIQQINEKSFWGNLKLYVRTIMLRYMRLTPVMIVTMLMSTMISDYLNMNSPFYMGENSGFYCKTNWWYNLLYIQNFLDMNVMCCSWTWYLACEMQYFILFTGLLFVHVKKPIVAKIVFVTLALGFVVNSWMCNLENKITFEIDVIYTTLNQLYINPWVRIPSYFGGATMGWLMHKLQHQQQQQILLENAQLQHREKHQVIVKPGNVTTETHHLRHQHHQPKYQSQHHCHHQQQTHKEHVGTFGRKTFWLFCIVLFAATNFMSYWRLSPIWVVAIIMSMGKLLFALCIGGVIIMCACGRGFFSRLNVMLSARPFLFLNKFCFSIYLLAPVVIAVLFGLRNEPTNFSDVGFIADSITAVVWSIIMAFFMLILIELPMQNVANCLLKDKKLHGKVI